MKSENFFLNKNRDKLQDFLWLLTLCLLEAAFFASLFHVALHGPGMEGANVGSHQQPSEVATEEEWGRSCACVSGKGNALGRSCDVVAVWGFSPVKKS